MTKLTAVGIANMLFVFFPAMFDWVDTNCHCFPLLERFQTHAYTHKRDLLQHAAVETSRCPNPLSSPQD